GNVYAFHGVYHDVVAPERIVQTFEYEGMPGHVVMETAVFEDLGDGKTRVVTQSVFQSVEDRDGMAASGMEVGVNEGYERMNELMATLQ
ncbi:MAG TPA: SRPBCC domain-containing protein, partial [Promineifilum sp.]|nr:SRPBCC domain-containing protein [Promineifilum sp.]